MPNHVENHIEFSGDKQRIDAMLEEQVRIEAAARDKRTS